MYEQIPLDPNTDKKKYFLRIILFILLAAATAYLFKTYDLVSYFKNNIKTATAPETAQAEVPAVLPVPFDERQVKEAFYMTRIAASLLQNDRNVTAATDLLSMALGRLDGMQGEQIEHARSILAADIAKLNNATALDSQSLQEKLATLDKLIAVLPLKHTALETKASPASGRPATATPAQQNKWPQTMQNIVTQAKSVVKISKKPAGNTPYSSDASVDIKRAQFKLVIEQLRWALFYREAAVYERSLAKAQELLPETFDVNSESVQKFAIILQELSQVNLNAAVPSIQDSVNALQAILVR